ncbi:MAG: hypothetical protein ACM3XO_27860 [Bacteroidota bacterium]|jgi:hypothetical protein
MTHRSFLAGQNQTIIIKAGGSVTVKGHDSDLILADTRDRWGLSVDRRSEAEIGRARAAIGERVLFDLRLKKPTLSASQEVIEVQMGGSGEVLVPFSSRLKVYAGKDIDVQDIQSQVDAYSGLNLKLKNVQTLGTVSAGRAMDVDCQAMAGTDVTFGAGSDLRFHVANLTSVRLRVKDIGGYWEARIGEAERSVYLKSGGDVIFVTGQRVEALPPNFILGTIEKPAME